MYAPELGSDRRAQPGFRDVPSWTPTLAIWSWLQTEKRKEGVTASTSPPPAGNTQQTVGLSGNQESSLTEPRSDTSITPGDHGGFGGRPQSLSPGPTHSHLLTRGALCMMQSAFRGQDRSPSSPLYFPTTRTEPTRRVRARSGDVAKLI